MAKYKKIVIYVLVAIFALSFSMLSFTTAKYLLKLGNSGSNVGGEAGDIPYALLDKVTVHTQEDLFNALEKGYPYITLADDVRDPLIVTQDTMEVKKSLVLDLNGKRLERISSAALMTVPQGVTLTIIDSNKGATGGLYNPVGTVLHVSGGSLNVRGGKYESGPRTWEYYTVSKEKRFPTTTTPETQPTTPTTPTSVDVPTSSVDTPTTSVDTPTTREVATLAETTDTSNERDVLYHYSESGVIKEETRVMPIITPNVTKVERVVNGEKKQVIKGVDGNVYFDVAYKDKNNAVLIPADTYCFYVTGDNFASGSTVAFDNSAADFSYSYYAYPETYAYKSATKPNDPSDSTKYVQVTVYGFEKDIQTAMGRRDDANVSLATGIADYNVKQEFDKIPWYAAVKMDGGTLNVDCEGSPVDINSTNYKGEFDYKSFGKGSFISYFGVETTACVQFTGGKMTVSTDGVFATVNPATVSAINEINNKDKPEAEKQYALSSEGRSVCIHNNGGGGGDGGNLTINKGNFLTYNMSVVRLMAGHCVVNNSNFYRVQNTKYYQHENKDDKDNIVIGHRFGTGTVYSAGGNIEVFGTKFWIYSDKDLNPEDAATITDYEGAYGIYSVNGNISVINSEITAIGDCCRGIYSNPYQYSEKSATQPSTEKGGQVELMNTQIKVFGQRTFGVYSRGGTVVFDGKTPTDKKDVQSYGSRLYVSGDKTMAVYANLFDDKGANPTPTINTSDAVKMINTIIVVNLLDLNEEKVIINAEHPNKLKDFNVAVNSIDANLSFENSRIESLAYGITALDGYMSLSDCSINTREAPAIIVKGDNTVSAVSTSGTETTELKSGTITTKGTTDIDCYIKQSYVDNCPNLWFDYLSDKEKLEQKNYFVTHSGIDIQNGLLQALKDKNSTNDHFILTFNTDIRTPETKDRIVLDENNKLPYVKNGDKLSEVFAEIVKNSEGKYVNRIDQNGNIVAGEVVGVQMNAASAMLPAAMSAIRVSGIKGQPALNITSNCTITAEVGGGILVRDGNVQLGDESDQNITIETKGSEYYSKLTYHFMNKDYWDYRDTSTGGNALFVSGGKVESKATNLTLRAALGNGLFVTGAQIRPDADFHYKGEITLADGITNPSPEVIIDAGTFEGNATEEFIDNKNNVAASHGTHSCSWGFHFTGPSSNYGVKVVCGGKVTINGGTFGGYGAVCTMGAITQTAVKAHLTINGDYRKELDRITMSGQRDVACFYNASEVIINSYDNPKAKIKTADKYDYVDPTDFGVAIPNGINTAMVIEAHSTAYGTNVTVNGGYYRAVDGDGNGAKAFWCSNTSATLTIEGGYFIGNKKGNNGGAIQQAGKLAECNLNGGYFFNFSDEAVLSGHTNHNVGTDAFGNKKKIYKLDNSSDHFATSTTEGTIWDSAVYIPYVQTPPEEQQQESQQ